MQDPALGSNNKCVQVLMSVYNGTDYLREQLQSIYGQESVDVRLLVRDDGSCCSALHELLDGEQKAGRLQWYEGPNLRPARSFMQLLRQAPEAAYYAFADQDDVWQPDKLAVAVERLAAADGPALYFSQTQLVDASLRPLPNVVIAPRLTLGEALVYQFVGGNTMVMNAALRELIVGYDPDYLRMHDIWIYDVALAVGARVVFDPHPHILYRQHGTNAVGQAASWRFRWQARWQRLRRERHIRSLTAANLLAGYSRLMTDESRRLVAAAALAPRSMRQRWRLLTDPAFRPADPAINVTFRLAAILGLF